LKKFCSILNIKIYKIENVDVVKQYLFIVAVKTKIIAAMVSFNIVQTQIE